VATVTGDLELETICGAASRAVSAATGAVVVSAEHPTGRRSAHRRAPALRVLKPRAGARRCHSHGEGWLAPTVRWSAGVEPRVDQVGVAMVAAGRGVCRVAGP
jgi:hypothetical protein